MLQLQSPSPSPSPEFEFGRPTIPTLPYPTLPYLNPNRIQTQTESSPSDDVLFRPRSRSCGVCHVLCFSQPQCSISLLLLNTHRDSVSSRLLLVVLCCPPLSHLFTLPLSHSISHSRSCSSWLFGSSSFLLSSYQFTVYRSDNIPRC